MNKMRRFTALSLSVLTLAATMFGACGGKSDDGKVTPESSSKYAYNGTHVYTATDTNDYLVRNGKTEYTLVIPASYSSSLRIAKTEFIDLFEDATGIELSVVSDDAVSSAEDGKYISLGETTLLRDSGISIDHKTLTDDGHRIVTKGDDVYLCGGTDDGTVFAVYTFMRLTFNYETYYYDCMEIEKATDKKLKDYDVTDIPDFKFRAHSTDVTCYESADYDENMFAWRLGYRGKEAHRGYFFMPVHEYIDDFTKGKSSASTNARRWFPEHMYKNEEDVENYHPLWFSDNGGEQLCFSAHGDPYEYEAMVQTAFEKVEAHLKHYTPDEYPRYKIMTLTHMDNTNYCTCDKCKEISSYYGDSQAAVQILFMNDLAAKVDALLEANKDADWYRDDFKLLFFAYNHNFVAPARYDAVKKEYVPIDDKVILNDRLIAWFAREANGQQVFDEGLNTTCMTTLSGWVAIAKHIYFWNYGTNFRNYVIPVDSFQYATPDMYAYYCNQSDDFWFTQYQDRNRCANTAWTNLKVYLDAKLSWNTSLSSEELTQKWMKAMYKDAAPTMLRLFQSVRAYYRNVLIDKYQASPSAEMSLVEYWPIGLLEGWIAQIDQAKSEVERFATVNPELYDRTCKHIEIEAISYLFLLLDTQGYTINSEDRAMYIDRITNDIEWLGIADMETRSKTTLVGWLSGL